MSEFKLVHNLETGEISEVALTADEIAQNVKDAKDAEKLRQEAAIAKAKKEAALAKLTELGLDLDDLRALGLG
jgi:hypothetical protein